MRRALAVALAVLLGPTVARADDAAPMTFEVDKERTTRDKLMIASFGAGALVFGGIGLLFHLDSRAKSDEVSASGRHTGLTYTDAVDDTRRDALRSRNLTIASYGIGAGLLVTTFVVYLVTDPGTETITLDGAQAAGPAGPPAMAIGLEPVAGGAIATGGWRF